MVSTWRGCGRKTVEYLTQERRTSAQSGFAIGMRSNRIEISIRFGAWSTETSGWFGRIFRLNFRSRARSLSRNCQIEPKFGLLNLSIDCSIQKESSLTEFLLKAKNYKKRYACRKLTQLKSENGNHRKSCSFKRKMEAMFCVERTMQRVVGLDFQSRELYPYFMHGRIAVPLNEQTRRLTHVLLLNHHTVVPPIARPRPPWPTQAVPFPLSHFFWCKNSHSTTPL